MRIKKVMIPGIIIVKRNWLPDKNSLYTQCLSDAFDHDLVHKVALEVFVYGFLHLAIILAFISKENLPGFGLPFLIENHFPGKLNRG